MRHLEERVAVVTGGANGIGFGLAGALLRAGMKLVVADIDTVELERAVTALAPLGEVIGHRTDVSRADDVDALAEAAMDRFGAVHLLCNNAGVGGFQRFETTGLGTWEWTLGVNLWGVIHGCRAFLPILKAQQEAHILNTASMAGFMYSAYNSPYTVSKAGVVALTESLAREFEAEALSIGVSVLCPAQVATSIADDERNAPPSHTPRDTADPDLRFVRDRVNASLPAGLDPTVVGDLCVEAIRANRLYVFSHPDWVRMIAARSAHIVAHEPGIPPIWMEG